MTPYVLACWGVTADFLGLALRTRLRGPRPGRHAAGQAQAHSPTSSRRTA